MKTECRKFFGPNLAQMSLEMTDVLTLELLADLAKCSNLRSLRFGALGVSDIVKNLDCMQEFAAILASMKSIEELYFVCLFSSQLFSALSTHRTDKEHLDPSTEITEHSTATSTKLGISCASTQSSHSHLRERPPEEVIRVSGFQAGWPHGPSH